MKLTLLVRQRFAVAILSLVAVAGLGTSARAAEVAVPGTSEGGAQNGNLFGTTARTVQLAIDSSLLTGLGSTITGIQFRLNGGVSTNAPSTNQSVTDLEIRIGTAAVALSSMTTTFANNISGATLVRDGAFTFTAGTLTGSGTTPNPFGTVFTFDTPYSYTSGTSIVIEIRHTGFATQTLVDGWSSNTSDSTYRAFQTNVFAGTTGSSVQFPVIALVTSAIPEPSTYAALAGVGVLGLAILRRRRVAPAQS